MYMFKKIVLFAVLVLTVLAGCDSDKAKGVDVDLQLTPNAVIGDVAIDYVVISSWDSGFQGEVTITNNGSAAITAWTLKWDFSDGQTIAYGWNVDISQTGTTVTAVNAAYNGTIASGGQVIFGFIGNHSGTNTIPTAFTFNGNTSGEDPLAPQVSITSPANNASYNTGSDITITASASDSDGTVSSVAFYNGTTLLGTDYSSPYEYTISSAAAGTYTLTATATDNDGLSSTSTAVTVTVGVSGDVVVISDAAPVKIEAEDYTNMSGIDTEEASEGTLNIGWIEAGDYVDYDVRIDTAGTYKVDYRVASASDTGAITFMLGSTNLGEITVPNTGDWQTWTTISDTVDLSLGENTIRLYASGSYWNLNYFIITKVTGDPLAPQVSITSPANNASYNAGSDITITASASDSDGTVSSVAFYNGTTLLGTDYSSPYEYTISSAAAGTYTLTATATDNDGLSTTSTAVTVTVNPVGNGKVVALTFDDGPDTSLTPLVLDKLENHGVVASFFVIGQKLNESTRSVVQRTISMGCEVHNHSWGYDSLTSYSASAIQQSVNDTTAAIIQYAGVAPQFFRPPNLATNSTMYANIDFPFCSGITANDWDQSTTAEQRANAILNSSQLRDGAIILLHDVQPLPHPTPEALDIIIPALKNQGYEFVTLSELFSRQNVDPNSIGNNMWVVVE